MFKGTLIAQFISVIGGLYLAKYYGPNYYGVFGVCVSLANILAIINTLQLEYSIVLTKKSADQKNLLSFLLALTFIISFCSFFIFTYIYPYFKFSISKYIILLSIICASFLSQIKIFEYFLVACNNFKTLSFLKALLSICTIAFQFTLFYFYKENGLIYGLIISLVLITCYFYIINYRTFLKIDIKNSIRLVKKNRSLVTYALPSNLLNSIANNVMPILIITYFSVNEAASYFLSVKILGVPLLLISNSVATPYFKKATEYYQKNDIRLLSFTKKIVATNLKLMCIALLLFNLIIWGISHFFFNEKWIYLLSFSFILNFLFVAKCIFSPISSIVEITNKNQIGLIFNTYLFCVNLVAIYIGVYFNNSIYTIVILSLLSGIGYIAVYCYFMTLIKKFNEQ